MTMFKRRLLRWQQLPLALVTFTCALASPVVAESAFGREALQQSISQGKLQVVERGETFAIYAVSVKEYPASRYLVQSSGTAIELGASMSPYMETSRLHEFVTESGIALAADAPLEVYLYHWTGRAQGPMIFDVGVPLAATQVEQVPNEHGFIVRDLRPLKVASIVYEGPFPYQEGSGWDRILWEDRAREAGHVYTERLYRELYHHYDWETGRHITEIQIEIE